MGPTCIQALKDAAVNIQRMPITYMTFPGDSGKHDT